VAATRAGEAPLLVVESYAPSVLTMPGQPATNTGIISSLRERGFEVLARDGWSFPHVLEHQLAINHELDALAVIDPFVEELSLAH
jgi:hypothetical protein